MPDNVFVILIISLALTLITEIALSLCFKIKEAGLIALVNVVTNPPAVFIAYVTGYTLPIMLALEVLVVVTEGALYSRFSEQIKRPFIYAIAVNTISFLIGVLL